MTITFPRDFPDIKIAISMMNIVPNQAIFKSGFTGKTQTQSHDAGRSDRWEGVYTTPILSPADIAKMDAFLTSLRGTKNTFKAFHPDRTKAINFVVSTATFDSTLITFDSTLETFDTDEFPSTGLVSGASQAGTSIFTDNWGFRDQTVLIEGDVFQIETQFYRVIEDVVTNSSAQATINFEPAIRTSHTDNTKVITRDAVMIARLSQQYDGTRTGITKTGVISFAFEEAL